ncbi:hypothetical protein QPL79_04545 [Ignisphaera sp. 4213-co]|uniref:Uncharacterized protein n=1 Tax=Ignisphaera cupida TaxID=3050454 RepID=A0ABD4Z6P9_9CREN|nr:hypothetical protein [Ignisphaera sp. 4213-co]MDK6028622.1 hypothetical protein [Ignisphaera sp. 4213-co]
MDVNVGIKKMVCSLVIGVFMGMLYYLVYVVIFPTLFSKILPNTEIPKLPGLYIPVFILFTALGLANSLVREHPISLPLKLLSKILGALVMLVLLNFGIIEGEIALNGVLVEYNMDISPLLYTLILFSLLIFP